MKNNGEKNKCDCVNKSICDEKLDKVVGGAVWSTEPLQIVMLYATILSVNIMVTM